jgi:hypothetical protein
MSRAERRRKDKDKRKTEQLDQTWEKQRTARRLFHERYSGLLEPLTRKQKTLMALELLWIFFGGPLVGLYYAFRKEPKNPYYRRKAKNDSHHT